MAYLQYFSQKFIYLSNQHLFHFISFEVNFHFKCDLTNEFFHSSHFFKKRFWLFSHFSLKIHSIEFAFILNSILRFNAMLF